MFSIPCVFAHHLIRSIRTFELKQQFAARVNVFRPPTSNPQVFLSNYLTTFRIHTKYTVLFMQHML